MFVSSSALDTLAFSPSFHLICKAARPLRAAPVWSAMTATASLVRTTLCTPFTAMAGASSTSARVPPITGQMVSTATLTPSGRASMPNIALPLTLSGESVRLAGVPISLNCDGSFSGTSPGSGNCAAASTNSP
ncbi:hypothetical protein FQZ97_903560 [compost metagenome]